MSTLSQETKRYLFVGVAVVLIGLLIVGLRFYYPWAVDWYSTFSQTANHIGDPYVIETFTNPPWVLFLIPHALLPVEWSSAINLTVAMVVFVALIYKYDGGWQALLLTFTSPLMFDLARTNNVDWIPALAFLLPPMWGLPLLAIKPQTLGGAALIWWKKEKFSWRMFVPLAVVIALSFVIWGLWPARVGLIERAYLWNFAPWPFFIPLGLYLLYHAWKKEDEILGAAATPFLVPYFAPYSLTPLLALVACRYPKYGLYVYLGFWMFTIIAARRGGF